LIASAAGPNLPARILLAALALGFCYQFTRYTMAVVFPTDIASP
jgi:hypothetical protein